MGDRPRPLAAAATAASPIAAGGGILAGLLYLLTLLQLGKPITPVDWILAAALTLVSAGPALLALRHTVKRAEPQVTPTEDPQTNDGDQLIPWDAQLLQQSLDELVGQRLRTATSSDEASAFAQPVAGPRATPTAATAGQNPALTYVPGAGGRHAR